MALKRSISRKCTCLFPASSVPYHPISTIFRIYIFLLVYYWYGFFVLSSCRIRSVREGDIRKINLSVFSVWLVRAHYRLHEQLLYICGFSSSCLFSTQSWVSCGKPQVYDAVDEFALLYLLSALGICLFPRVHEWLCHANVYIHGPLSQSDHSLLGKL